MTAGSKPTDTAKRLRRIGAVALALFFAAGVLFVLFNGAEAPVMGATVGERIAVLKAERSSLQARADGEARIGLLQAFRVASLLTDALAARYEADAGRMFDRLPSARHQPFAELDRLNTAIKDALDRPSEGARRAARKAVEPAEAQLDRIAGLDDAPAVLTISPRFVQPRRATGELTLTPGAAGTPPPVSRTPATSTRTGGSSSPEVAKSGA